MEGLLYNHILPALARLRGPGKPHKVIEYELARTTDWPPVESITTPSCDVIKTCSSEPSYVTAQSSRGEERKEFRLEFQDVEIDMEPKTTGLTSGSLSCSEGEAINIERMDSRDFGLRNRRERYDKLGNLEGDIEPENSQNTPTTSIHSEREVKNVTRSRGSQEQDETFDESGASESRKLQDEYQRSNDEDEESHAVERDPLLNVSKERKDMIEMSRETSL